MSIIFNRLVCLNCSYFSDAREVSLFFFIFNFKIKFSGQYSISSFLFENIVMTNVSTETLFKLHGVRYGSNEKVTFKEDNI